MRITQIEKLYHTICRFLVGTGGIGCLLCLFISVASAQDDKRDQQFFFGSLSLFDFKQNPPATYTPQNSIIVFLDGTNASIADTSGNFQFCYDGVRVVNHKRNIMDGGTGLNSPLFEQENSLGLITDQCAIVLPKQEEQYYLFYASRTDSAILQGKTFDRLYYAIVDMSANNGEGKVIQKQIPLLENIYLQNGTLTAVRHANGKDWWLIKQRNHNPGFYVFRVTADSIYPPVYRQFVSGAFNQGYICQAVFNPQGNLIALSSSADYEPTVLLHFDRCDGTLSKWIELPISNEGGFVSNKNIYCCFSPSGRYLYTNNLYYLFQFDLQSVNVPLSKVFIDSIDYQNGKQIANMIVGYDQRIYVDNWNGIYTYLSVIEHPDSAGQSCYFHKEAIQVDQQVPGLGGAGNGLPDFPNFRLGAVPSTDNQQNQTIYYCAGDSITLSRKHYPYSRYRWHDGSSTLTTDTLRYALRPIGNRTIYLSLLDSTCSCGNRTDTIRLIAVSDTTIHHSHSDTICVGDTLRIGSSYPNSRYEWYKHGALIGTADSISATRADTLVLYSIDTVLHCIHRSDTFYISSQNCDTIDSVPARAVGIFFFPNPANDYIEYSINDSTLNTAALSLQLVAANGTLVLQKAIVTPAGKIDISPLASGVYVLSLSSDKQVKYRKKWVVW